MLNTKKKEEKSRRKLTVVLLQLISFDDVACSKFWTDLYRKDLNPLEQMDIQMVLMRYLCFYSNFHHAYQKPNDVHRFVTRKIIYNM